MANYNDKKTLNPYRCKDCSKKTCSPVLMSFKKNMSSCSHVFQKKHVLMFPCLSNKNMSSCSSVFQKKHVLMFSCLSKKTCPHVPMSFKKKHVLMFFCLSKKKHVLMFSCLSKKNMFFCSSVFSKTCSHVSTCPHSKIKDTFIQLKFSFCVII